MARAVQTASSPLTGIKFRYAVVDLASAPGLGKIVMGRLSREAQPLFAPDLAFDILAAGPWLADLNRLPELEPAIDAGFKGVPWGFYVETSGDIVSLRRLSSTWRRASNAMCCSNSLTASKTPTARSTPSARAKVNVAFDGCGSENRGTPRNAG